VLTLGLVSSLDDPLGSRMQESSASRVVTLSFRSCVEARDMNNDSWGSAGMVPACSRCSQRAPALWCLDYDRWRNDSQPVVCPLPDGGDDIHKTNNVRVI
jgi:hypothetical protein